MFRIFKNLFGDSPDSGELKQAISEGAFLVDVRTFAEFVTGSAQGAVNIPLDKISGQLEKFKGKNNIVVFCRSGNRSGQAQGILERNGFKNVFNGGTWENVDKIIKETK